MEASTQKVYCIYSLATNGTILEPGIHSIAIPSVYRTCCKHVKQD